MRNPYLFAIPFAVVALCLCVMQASACSCLAQPSVLDEYDRSQDVFIAEIIAVDIAKDEYESLGKREGVAGARVRVEKSFKGTLKKGSEVFFEQGGGANCIWTYNQEQIGQRILVYNSPHKDRRYISECGRSNGLRFVADDLRYLENMDKVRGKTRIAGIYKFGFFGGVPQAHSVEGKKIKFVGKARTFRTVTDKDGVYEIYDLPPGKYYIEAEPPPGWKLDRYMVERSLTTQIVSPELIEFHYSLKRFPNRIPIRVETGKHISLDLPYEIDNSITGTVVGPTGKPMKGVCVTAVPADKTEFKYGPSRCTDKQGRFVLNEIYFKEFVLVINGDGEVSGDEPVPMTFFPRGADRSAAQVFKIDEGVKLAIPTFRIRTLVETVTLKGTLFYSDGSTVTSHQKVQFISDTQDKTQKSDPYDYTDDFGRFELTILKGQTGKIRGEIIMGERQRLGCPEVLKAVIEKHELGGIFTAATQWRAIAARKSESDIELSFAFAECKVP